jgi:hypothetical protein
VTCMEDYSYGQCIADVGPARLNRCNQAAIDEGGFCRFHGKVAMRMTDSSLFATRTNNKPIGVFSHWTQP